MLCVGTRISGGVLALLEMKADFSFRFLFRSMPVTTFYNRDVDIFLLLVYNPQSLCNFIVLFVFPVNTVKK